MKRHYTLHSLNRKQKKALKSGFSPLPMRDLCEIPISPVTRQVDYPVSILGKGFRDDGSENGFSKERVFAGAGLIIDRKRDKRQRRAQ